MFKSWFKILPIPFFIIEWIAKKYLPIQFVIGKPAIQIFENVILFLDKEKGKKEK